MVLLDCDDDDDRRDRLAGPHKVLSAAMSPGQLAGIDLIFGDAIQQSGTATSGGNWRYADRIHGRLPAGKPVSSRRQGGDGAGAGDVEPAAGQR